MEIQNDPRNVESVKETSSGNPSFRAEENPTMEAKVPGLRNFIVAQSAI